MFSLEAATAGALESEATTALPGETGEGSSAFAAAPERPGDSYAAKQQQMKKVTPDENPSKKRRDRDENWKNEALHGDNLILE